MEVFLYSGGHNEKFKRVENQSNAKLFTAKGGARMIELQHISKQFHTKNGVVQALQDVNLHIQKGEIYGVIGFSGAGKSTLVRCINLLERVNGGQVIVDGEDLSKLKEKQLRHVRKKIGMIFQHFNLMRSRTVFQNIAFPLKGSGLSKVQIKEKVHALLELVELSDKEHAYPSQLSGGQKQRVAIARALANDPKVLLCDEATSALDPQTTQSILKLLKEVNQRLDLTIVLITHEMAVVKDICDRVAVMEQGCVIEEGNIVDIFRNPKTEVAHNFINSTSSLTRIYDMIKEGQAITQLQEGQWMVHLRYGANNAKEAVLSHVARELKVDSNIIFGNVEIVHGSPIGDMVVILSTQAGNIEDAITYLQGQAVKVEVLKQC